MCPKRFFIIVFMRADTIVFAKSNKPPPSKISSCLLPTSPPHTHTHTLDVFEINKSAGGGGLNRRFKVIERGENLSM